MENFDIGQYMPIIKVGIALLLLLIIVVSIKRMIRRLNYKINRKIDNLFSINTLDRLLGSSQYGLSTKDVATAINEARAIPEVKSVGGMTSMFLEKIKKDFPNYHNSEIENIIEKAVQEYIEISYGMKESFNKNVSNRIKVSKNGISGSVSNVTHNGIAIYNYKKAVDYATVVYRCSVGYDLNGNRVETRFEVDYSYELATEQNENMGLFCPICGGRYDSIHDTKCPYCGALVVKDTYMNWFVTNIKEI